MVERDHPWFGRRVTTLLITAAIGSGAIVGNLLGFLGPVLLAPAVGIPFTALLIGGSIYYGFWAARRIDCPECSARCEKLGGESGKGNRVVCRECGIIWDLGISFTLKDE
ncbi:MAG TPA: hypothetical protein VLA34_08770 [Candidatus Krumholzibacterium sp.]|nr:hypothetical protein [Candidatus Krumholzibacterium sp.]